MITTDNKPAKALFIEYVIEPLQKACYGPNVCIPPKFMC